MNRLDTLVIPRRGAKPRPTGAGTHGDRRTKRVRTRGAARRAAIRDAGFTSFEVTIGIVAALAVVLTFVAIARHTADRQCKAVRSDVTAPAWQVDHYCGKP